MEENKNKTKLSTFIIVLAILVIIIMAGYIYMQKVSSDREISGLKSDAEGLKNTVAELEGKLDNISNIASDDKEKNKTVETNTNKSKENYDVEISNSELENLNYSNEAELKAFYNKYNGKKVKITGYVRHVDDNVMGRDTGISETLVSLVSNSNPSNNDNDIACATTSDTDLRNELKTLKKGQKISIIGIIDENFQPVTLYDFYIVK